MKDQYGRNINYMRVSVTDRCNLRCTYCMPAEGVPLCSHDDILRVEEIDSIIRTGASLGINKVRITGGEPLIRRGILKIVENTVNTPGISSVCMTTNGILLPQYATSLKELGLERLNISLDTLNPDRYRKLTRGGDLADVRKGLEAAANAGFTGTKINTVLIGGINDDEIPALAALSQDHELSVRFIELMPMGQCMDWPEERFLANSSVLTALPQLEPAGTDGVTRLYRLPGAKGTIGLISPMSAHFCPDCNRIRITSDGRLKPCLHSDTEINLKGIPEEELLPVMEEAVYRKPSRHRLTETHHSESHRTMNAIGG
ncbi:MAG: GTP 3',8-cyclase MoaA [Eubacteriaceae bacterium]|jgi:cyclic pyranopterin phosphate synthase